MRLQPFFQIYLRIVVDIEEEGDIIYFTYRILEKLELVGKNKRY